MNKKLILCCAGIAILTGCTGKKSQQAATTSVSDTLYMLVGSYGPADQEGIKVYKFNQAIGEGQYVSGVKGISNPSYQTVSKDGKRVYSVGEDDGGTASAHTLTFDAATGTLTLINSQPTQGAAPCHIALSPEEDYVVTANYNGSNISLFPLDGKGRLKPGQTIGFEGSGPDKERQAIPHLHFVYFTPDNHYLLANDLGTDRIHRFPLNTRQKGSNTPLVDRQRASDIRLTPGSGPRHAVFSADGRFAYLITELSGEVMAFTYDGDSLSLMQTVQADTLDARGSADIHLSPDGRFLYASNRLKGDGLAIFRVNPEDGTLSKAGYQPTGIHPRNFVLTPNGQYLLVACRDTDEIQIFARDASTGLLTDTGRRIKTTKPVCLKFID
ncbi:lactonase family protein [Caecibacteroides pullorum]|uniref:Lactonase family protein n=1 Tax=Caecibacteroides pullorum TaxID=2725562 RepID=A0AA40ZVH7_9BACT|nr:lactonase family protein [Caecibacteroides pullorum]MBM6858507.1 lactonase family protein [Caecibacteroides pullorum]MBV8038692.1 lactonase family protein [Caecibacteroides pullorum]MBV8059513.1 lactonase family protein [Caecibacteroides pullorum]MDC6280281.1 lactonase family protein [Caecibacteroides pullorum]